MNPRDRQHPLSANGDIPGWTGASRPAKWPMREARVLVHGRPAAVLSEDDDRRAYVLPYREGYEGSLRRPVMPGQTTT